MSEEKRMLGNYEVTQSIYVGDKEVVLAVDKKEQYPFRVVLCLYHTEPAVSVQRCDFGFSLPFAHLG